MNIPTLILNLTTFFVFIFGRDNTIWSNLSNSFIRVRCCYFELSFSFGIMSLFVVLSPVNVLVLRRPRF